MQFAVRGEALVAGVMGLMLGVSAQAAPTLEQRTAAATAVASGDAECTKLTPFYWEIGDAGGARASGQGGTPVTGADKTYTSSSTLAVASGAKWVFATYLIEQAQGLVSEEMRQLLTMQGGYTNEGRCTTTTTVSGCLAEKGVAGSGTTNRDRNDAYVGRFYYNSGHMQVLGERQGYGGYTASTLTTNALKLMANAKGLQYTTPELAAGLGASVSGYAQFLRNIVAGTYPSMRALLGTSAVCTTPNSTVCPTAVYSPINNAKAGGQNVVSEEQWHYSLGHWVEDDPGVGDGAFSSPGRFGFYPWIDASKTWYGVLARYDTVNLATGNAQDQPYITSVRCGRKIRAAWMSGGS